MANRLVKFVTSSNVSDGSSALAGLEAQAAALTTQVNKYDQEIKLEEAAIQGEQPEFAHSPSGYSAPGLVDHGPVERVVSAPERK